jgi:hypothetical protein
MDTLIGKIGTVTHSVTTKDTAKTVKSGTLDVLATPVLSALMEEAAVKAITPFLPPDETTVGGYIALTHKAPTKVGDRMTVIATVTKVDGRKIHYHITAKDTQKDIGEAEHTRFIVNSHDFMKKLLK